MEDGELPRSPSPSSDSRSDYGAATETTYLIDKVPPSSSPPPYTSTADGEVNIDEEELKHIVTRSYPARWYVLFVYCLHLASNITVWITTSPISDITACYYGVSLWWINAVSWTFMLTYVLFFLPVARFLDSYGLRATAIVAGCINAIGCWLRYAGSGTALLDMRITRLLRLTIISSYIIRS